MMVRKILVSLAAMSVCIILQCECLPLKSDGDMSKMESFAASPFAFDYLHLVQEWPGSFCDTKMGCKWPSVQPKTGWLLHGLWPEFNNGSWPQYCDPSAPFNMSAIEDLLPELQAYWPSLVSPDQSAFWSHEWTRHGTCAEGLTPREQDYFRLVLNLREQFDVYEVLAAAGIAAGAVTTWKDVKAALDGAFRYQVEVGCNQDSKGRLQLFEVRTCYRPVPATAAAAARRLGLGAGGVVSPEDCPNAASAVSCGTPSAPLLVPPFQA